MKPLLKIESTINVIRGSDSYTSDSQNEQRLPVGKEKKEEEEEEKKR